MRCLTMVTVVCVLFATGSWAQEEIPETPEAVETDEIGEETEEPTFNVSEQQKISRLAAASGKTEAEIIALRNGTAPPPPEPGEAPEGGEPPESVEGIEAVEDEAIEAGKRMGWGQVAHALGLHPGILGHGTGDKFMPELPEIDPDAMAAVTTARETAMERKAERWQTGATAQQSHRDARAEKARGASIAHERKPEKVAKPERTARPERVARPERSARPEKKDNPGKGNKK
jgi:hypothetical protein